MFCNKCKCKYKCEFIHIDKEYIAHGKYQKCDGNYCEKQLNKHVLLKFFSNLHDGCTDEQFRLRKGVYSYEYMDSFERFTETELPLKEEFYSKLNLSNISDNDYEHAQNVWKAFNLKNLANTSFAVLM